MKSKSKTKIMKFSWFKSFENNFKRKLILNIHTLTKMFLKHLMQYFNSPEIEFITHAFIQTNY